MSGRRGAWAMERLGKMILVLAGFAIIIFLLNMLFSILGQESGPQACRTSVMGRMGIKESLPGVVDDSASRKIPLACKTEEATVPEKVSLSMTDEEVREKTMDDLADLMATCWWMFGNGQFNDVFGNKWKDSDLCHICYNVQVRDVRGLEQPITVEEFKEYLDTHHYAPGLLRAGGAANADYRFYEYQAQETRESSRQSRQMTPERLLGSKRHLETNLADFTALFQDSQADLDTLRGQLDTILLDHDLAFTIILVPSLTPRVWENEEPVAMDILNEWNIGSETLNNGYVLLFSLNDGKLQYANDVGSSAALPAYIMDGLLDHHLAPKMGSGEPKQAIIDFTQGVLDALEQQSQDTEAMMLFQRTYSAYITGGRVGSSLVKGWILTSDTVRPKGSIAFGAGQAAGGFDLRSGESYAISFTSPEWYNLQAKSDATKAPTITLAYSQDFITGDTPCNVHED
ncbi:TPM domain-containing protein [Candidatus Woesearchaeota archaeon]|nr:TPM domain-containing protein [Candidatus Woesearchaeota archaeon]